MATQLPAADDRTPADTLKCQTWTLKVSIHCEGCKKKVKKVLQAIEGVYTIMVDAQQHRVTVTGNVGVETLIKKLAKSGKHAELWPEPKKEKKPPAAAKSKNTNDQKQQNSSKDGKQQQAAGDKDEHRQASAENPQNAPQKDAGSTGEKPPATDKAGGDKSQETTTGEGGNKKKKNKKGQNGNNTDKPQGDNNSNDAPAPTGSSSPTGSSAAPDPGPLPISSTDVAPSLQPMYPYPPVYYVPPMYGVSYSTVYPTVSNLHYAPDLVHATNAGAHPIQYMAPLPSDPITKYNHDDDNEDYDGSSCSIM